jgi:hypothetical protein
MGKSQEDMKMKKMRSHLVLLYCLCMALGIFSLFPKQATAVCPINKNGTYIEAENFSGGYNIDSSTHDNDWFLVNDVAGTNGGKILISGSNGSATDNPRKEVKEYKVSFPEAGTYKIWIRGKASAGGDGSMFFGIDTVATDSWKAWNYDNKTVFTWTSAMQIGASNTINVASIGEHTIKIAMREAGSQFDGFYITMGTETPTDATVPSTVTTINPKAGCTGPNWTVTPTSLGPTCFQGYNAASMSFTLTNIGENDTTTAMVSSNKTWAVVANNPIPVLNKDGSYTVTINFNTASLAIGTQLAELTVTGSAINSPLKIPITLLVKDVPATAACGEIPLYAENLVNPAIMVQLDTSGSMDTQMTIATIVDQSTPELKTIVQSIVNRADWAANNDIAFMISGTGKRSAWSRDGQPDTDAPKLILTYQVGTNPAIPEERLISSSGDDGQKASATTIDLTATSLELGRTDAPVGLRFTDISVPQGATIVSAKISFSTYAADSTSTSLTIKGVNQGNVSDLSFLTAASPALTAGVTWNNVVTWAQSMSRINIAEDVLKEVFLDRSIAWGFATWAGGNGNATDSVQSPTYYTNYRIGVHEHDDAHQTALQAIADDGSASGYTPLVPTALGGLEYFKGNRADGFYNEKYSDLSCQPRILVLVTDGEGNTATTNTAIDTATQALITEGVSVVVVGFGLTTTAQLDRIAQAMQTAGEANPDDYLYHLHKENALGVAIPFMAQNRQEFIDAMNSIVSSVKAQVFHGSSPAPTTSVDNGELLLNASFDASNWSGKITATKFDAYTGVLATSTLWNSKDSMPVTINGFMYDSAATSKVSPYTAASIIGDNFLCKPMGDIINSTPSIVGKPPYYYKFDSYSSFKYNTSVRGREPLAYVGANDGAIHAFRLSNGSEKWRFYPDSVKAKMALALTSPKDDMCSAAYCHKFLLDGSPEPADIFAASAWHTILTTGLGEGGRAYFALDVTYGNDFAVATTNPSKFLWEFNYVDDAAIGKATSIPATARVVNGTGTGWATYFGSGEEEIDINQPDKEAYLFAVNSWDKSKVWKDAANVDTYKIKLSSTTLKNDYPAPPLVVESRIADYMADRIYLGNLFGNMYRVRDIGFGEKATSAMLYNSGKTDHATPVSAKAEYASIGNGDLWIYFGTGKYLDQVDKFTVDQQYFHGLLDVGAAKSTPYTPSDLVQMSTEIITAYALDKNGLPVDLNKDGVVNSSDLAQYRTLSCTAPDAAGSCNPDNESWRLKLAIPIGSASERTISQPLVVAGIVFFTTFVPDGDVCAGNGKTWLFALDWESGEFVTDAVFDINKDGKFDSSDKTVKSGTEIEGVAGIYIGEGRPSGEIAIHNDLLFVGTTGQPPQPIKVNLPDMQTKLRSWQQVSH